MEIYTIKLENKTDTIKQILYSVKKLASEYDRMVFLGINLINVSDKKWKEFKEILKNTGMKIFVFKDLPPCVSSYVFKYKLCDFSLSIEFKKNYLNLVLFGGSGYPVNSYQKGIFLNNLSLEYDFKEEKTEVHFLNNRSYIQKYIGYVFKNKLKTVRFIKNSYGLYYFKVNDNYYVLNKNFSSLINITDEDINKKIKSKLNTKTYLYDLDDKEFDPYSYMLNRKMSCLFLQNGSIIFDRSYYTDYLRVIYYLEFLC